jgi:hypothetical protein
MHYATRAVCRISHAPKNSRGRDVSASLGCLSK